MNSPKVTVWNEYRHEKMDEAIAKLYPEGIHAAIAHHLRGQGLTVRTAMAFAKMPPPYTGFSKLSRKPLDKRHQCVLN